MKTLNICDNCADKIGALKEVFKTGGCTCDVCGFSYPCTTDKNKSTVSRTPLNIIPDTGWHWIEQKVKENE